MLTFFGVAALAATGLAGIGGDAPGLAATNVLCGCRGVCAERADLRLARQDCVCAEQRHRLYRLRPRDPVVLVIGYIPWVGLLPYVIARGMAMAGRGVSCTPSRRPACSAWSSPSSSNTFVHAWRYYGETPLQFFGGVAAMACVPLAGGFLLYALAFPLRGYFPNGGRILHPVMALPMMFAGVGLPLYLALSLTPP